MPGYWECGDSIGKIIESAKEAISENALCASLEAFEESEADVYLDKDGSVIISVYGPEFTNEDGIGDVMKKEFNLEQIIKTAIECNRHAFKSEIVESIRAILDRV